MFFIFFFIFPKKKFLFYISFKYFLLLALVSEFNCFVRSRCSMEMWCPGDIGRDSWDWVGPPAWREHASTPQSGVEAPRLLKRSLLRLYCCCCVVVLLCVVVCCCCCWWWWWCCVVVCVVLLCVVVVVVTTENEVMSIPTQLGSKLAREPSMAKNSSPSRAPKTGDQLRDNLEERKKCGKQRKPSFIAAITALLKAEYLSLLRAGMSTDFGDELNLGRIHTHGHRDVHNLDELRHRGTCRCTQRACNDLVQSFNELQLWKLGCLLRACTRELDLHNKDIDHLVNVRCRAFSPPLC